MTFKYNFKNQIRDGKVNLRGKSFKTPVFMPVGTVGSVKSVTPDELSEIGYEIILGNTYHLYLRPGEKLIKKAGGLHKFINWPGLILTDSGGYQVFSLGENKFKIPKPKETNINSTNDIVHKQTVSKSLVKIKNGGVEFKSFLDGSTHQFTPKKVVQIQLDLGSDIIMPLDVCPPGQADYQSVKNATELSIDWLKQAKKYFDKMTQNLTDRPALFAIVQGGVFPDLRKFCAEEMIKLNLDGYAIGGLAVGENKKDMQATVKLMNNILPKDKPRYLMGVGEPSDMNFAIHNGMDMFDCVLPTRLARHGSVWVYKSAQNVNGSKNSKLIKNEQCKSWADKKSFDYSRVDMTSLKMKEDFRAIDSNCGCYTCQQGFSRAYLRHLMISGEILGHRLLTLHNLYFAKNYLEQVSNNGDGSK